MENANQFANRYISILYRYGQRIFAHQLKGHPVEAGHVPFLMQARRFPGITQEGISCHLGMDKGTTARGLKSLEELDLVRREADENDRRINHIYVTQKGILICGYVERMIADYHEILYRGLSQEEIELVTGLLIRMNQNVQSYLNGQKSCRREEAKESLTD